jgi:hypothetical protein
MLVLGWSGKYMSWPVAAWMTVWALGWMWVNRRPRGVETAFAAILAVLLIFAIPAQLVRNRIHGLLPAGEQLIELSTTPAPSNPLCWRVIVTTRTAEPAGSPPVDYFAREGVMVLRPWGLGEEGGFGATDPQRCPPRVFGENNALIARVEAPSLLQSDLSWAGEFRGSLSEFRRAVRTHCRVRAVMRFVRMPFWLIAPGGEMIAGDLRYHSGNGLGFADVESFEGEKCYEHEPSWTPPGGLFDAGNMP